MIIGPMYSGKTNELLRLIRRYRIAKKNCLLIKSTLDDRYNNGDLIVAHNKYPPLYSASRRMQSNVATFSRFWRRPVLTT